MNVTNDVVLNNKSRWEISYPGISDVHHLHYKKECWLRFTPPGIFLALISVRG
jgi:hypothetical protein